ncbi:hypothetical protein FHS74_003705 [Nitrospirillum iridis]|uniref:Uncharacterized protein n=1 Tax=Nitrospirillum iridis TaxID=765888 RepID=A0A7X0B1A6_9PROT|nr:hypothetical protein [Nitrospirillum iridis]
MPIEHPPPTEATVKSLYAHAFGCAFEGCSRTLYRLDNETGTRTLNSRVCHIHARREGGPRWDPSQSAEDNRAQQNLILMCVEHAAQIDIPETLSAHPPERLREWKQRQLEQYDRVQQGWALDADMVREAIDASQSDTGVVISSSTVSLGGEGGKAPGAGGGGGGAVGRGARGGRGGDGGGHRIDSGNYTLPWPVDRPTQLGLDELAGLSVDFVPGVGGGGGGANGNDATGGDGGGGGEAVSAVIDLAEMRKDGLDRVEVIVGKGGVHGGDGEDSILNFVTEDGKVLKTIGASGGKAGGSTLPEGATEITIADIRENFRVTTFLIANAVEMRDGLLYLLGADWGNFRAACLPLDIVLPVVYALRWSACQWSEPRGLFLSLIRPDGSEVRRQALVVPMAISPGGCYRGFHSLNVRLDTEGIWTLRLHSGRFLLAQLDMPVDRTESIVI